ncbi:glutathione S-transferase family protein [Phenylobacterium aquaticum]|uniref:glutathione S-transferase family protein n=1 Tax=Phenylobacterium aquaticum TaxID=1763816 RepID=UPI0023510A1B|nr:glutathione S-transferase family protein [Phenylobacterium aquaticum]
MAEIILHHYDTSPFSEKVRVMLGLKGLAWSSVLTPNMMPKPDLVPLTGGYRKAPVMQIGADIYCDSQVILAEIEARAPSARPTPGADWGVNIWADRVFFGATVPVVFGELGHLTPKAFIEDREKLSGRPFDVAAMAQAAGPMRVQWRAQAGWIEEGLAAAPFLCGEAPGLADVAAYMNIWWLGGALPDTAAALTAGFTRLAAWKGRMAALGHGHRTEITGAAALAIAKAAEPGPAPAHDAADPLSPGQAVTVMADDYGRDPIAGTVVAATPQRLVIARDTADLGRLHLHFPRVGFVAIPGAKI